MASQATMPAFVNPAAGSAAAVLALLDDDPRFAVERVAPERLRLALDTMRAGGARRVLVAGGDGTLALAAGALAGSAVELAVLPAGTLNHFAKRIGLPSDPQAALALAANGRARRCDVGYVNDKLFLNTSSVGNYVRFVRLRERLERRMGYRAASVLAGLRALLGMKSFYFQLEGRVIRTPLMFIGIQERETALPTLGESKPQGRRGLHAVVVPRGSRLAAMRLATEALLRGLDALDRERRLVSVMRDEFELRSRHRRLYVATDGEIERLATPLSYRFVAQGLWVVADPGE